MMTVDQLIGELTDLKRSYGKSVGGHVVKIQNVFGAIKTADKVRVNDRDGSVIIMSIENNP